MIDVVGAVAAASAVQTETPVDIANAQVPAPAGSLPCFTIGDPLACIFSDPFSPREWFGSEAAATVD
jgi:hypothetical protein